MTNRLYYGDNLEVLRTHIADASVDLIYLDPPFNSNATYSHLFRSPDGAVAQSQITAFDDSWEWGESAVAAYNDVLRSGNTNLAEILRAMRGFLKENAMMAYLAMMAVRLIELHRVLKPTGSLYLHCDPTASHYLKLILDGVFGTENFRTEIVWRRTNARSNTSRTYADITDTIFFYTKSKKFTFNKQFVPFSEKHLTEEYKFTNEDGRRYMLSDLRNPGLRPNLRYDYKGFKPHPNGWAISREKMEDYDRRGYLHFPAKPDGRIRMKRFLDEREGTPVPSLWSDIPPIHPAAQERLGYPTQKPLALLERIIAASSNPADVVLDPFCGCGTAVDAAQKLGRQWIGIDVTHLAIGLIEKRMKDRYGTDLAYDVIGMPADLASALRLAEEKPHDFQYWITFAIDGQAYQGGRKGMDRGIDGFVYFTGHDRGTERAIISVKAGRNVGPAMIRDLKGVMEREKAPMGIFVCAAEPTAEMKREAAAADNYDAADGRSYPRVQIFTLEDLFAGRRPRVPLLDARAAYKRAPREARATQEAMDV